MSLALEPGFFNNCLIEDAKIITNRSPSPAATAKKMTHNAVVQTATRTDTDGELAALVQAIVDGDKTALGRLYDATVARVYSLAHALTGNPDDAEEVVGDVYLQIWRKAIQYDRQRGSVTTWLLVHCRSLAFDLLRRRRSRQSGQENYSQQAAVEADTAVTADDLVNLLQEGSAVRQALQQLSEAQRRLITLAFFRDLSHPEIAAATGLPLGTVKSHIRRGLKKLRELLDSNKFTLTAKPSAKGENSVSPP